ncbi:hypothetical protein HK101_002239 [Irineochytrium annulatum]|nr:hypothetical protein HK101_002239 [Irineochytrium annulatum]
MSANGHKRRRPPTLDEDKRQLLRGFARTAPILLIIDQVLAIAVPFRLRYVYLTVCAFILAMILRSEPTKSKPARVTARRMRRTRRHDRPVRDGVSSNEAPSQISPPATPTDAPATSDDLLDRAMDRAKAENRELELAADLLMMEAPQREEVDNEIEDTIEAMERELAVFASIHKRATLERKGKGAAVEGGGGSGSGRTKAGKLKKKISLATRYRALGDVSVDEVADDPAAVVTVKPADDNALPTSGPPPSYKRDLDRIASKLSRLVNGTSHWVPPRPTGPPASSMVHRHATARHCFLLRLPLIPLPPLIAFRSLTEMSERQRWDAICLASDGVEPIDEQTWVQREKIRIGGGINGGEGEAIMLAHWRRYYRTFTSPETVVAGKGKMLEEVEEGVSGGGVGFLSFGTSITHPRCPVVEGIPRVEVNLGGLLVAPVKDDLSSCEIFYLCNFKPDNIHITPEFMDHVAAVLLPQTAFAICSFLVHPPEASAAINPTDKKSTRSASTPSKSTPSPPQLISSSGAAAPGFSNLRPFPLPKRDSSLVELKVSNTMQESLEDSIFRQFDLLSTALHPPLDVAPRSLPPAESDAVSSKDPTSPPMPNKGEHANVPIRMDLPDAFAVDDTSCLTAADAYMLLSAAEISITNDAAGEVADDDVAMTPTARGVRHADLEVEPVPLSPPAPAYPGHRFTVEVESLVRDVLQHMGLVDRLMGLPSGEGSTAEERERIEGWGALVAPKENAPLPRVSVFDHEARTQAYLVRATFENSAERTFDLCADVVARNKWDDTCESVTIVEHLDPLTAILHLRFKGGGTGSSASSPPGTSAPDSFGGTVGRAAPPVPPSAGAPVAGREALLLYHVRELEGGQYLNVTKSVDHDAVPEGTRTRTVTKMAGILHLSRRHPRR